MISGGAGFIGSHVADYLINLGANVVVIDNLSTGKLSNLPKSVEFIEMDLSNLKHYRKLKNINVDAVFHFAAQSSGEASFLDPIYDFQSHTISTFYLLNFCKQNSIFRFLFSSSMSVYGDPVSVPVNEIHKTQPKSFYGIGKVVAENYVKFFQKNGLLL